MDYEGGGFVPKAAAAPAVDKAGVLSEGVPEDVLLSRIVDGIESEPRRRLLSWLSLLHWFDDRVLGRIATLEPDLDVGAEADALERAALVEHWADRARAVVAPVRRLLIDRLVATEPSRHVGRSGMLAAIFGDLAENDGDVFDHIESVYHRLVAEPDRGTELLLADGLAWKSEPLFAHEALARLVAVATELKDRKLLPRHAADVVQFLSLHVPSGRKKVRDEVPVLRDLLETTASAPGVRRPLATLFRAELSLRLGLGELQLGRTDAARALFEMARHLFAEAGVRRGEADAIRALGRVALRRDELAEARRSFESALALFEELGLRVSAAHCVKSLAETAFYQGAAADAEALFQRALDGFSATGGHLGEANTRVVYSQLLAAYGRFDEAFAHIDRATAIYQTIDQQLGLANCLKNRCVVLFDEARYGDALQVLAEALALYEPLGSISGMANCRLWSAACETRLGRPDAALPLLDRAGTEFEGIGDRFGQAGVLRERGLAEIERGRPGAAIECLERAEACFRAVGNRVEARAAAVGLGRAAAAAGFPPPYSRSRVRELALAARDAFQDIGFTRFLAEAEELLRVLEMAA